MLHVDQHPVEAGTGDDLGRRRRGEAQPQPDLLLPGLDRALEVVLRKIVEHGGSFPRTAGVLAGSVPAGRRRHGIQWISGSATLAVPERKAKSQPLSAWLTFCE